MESGSFTYLAFNPDLAVHFLNEAGGDGKPQAGAAVGSRRRTVRLRECFKNRVLFFDWNADACVCDGKVQMALTVGRRLMFTALLGVPIAPGAKYDLVDTVNYKAEKVAYKGKEIQEVQKQGVHVIVLEKRAASEDVESARKACREGTQ